MQTVLACGTLVLTASFGEPDAKGCAVSPDRLDAGGLF